METSTTRWKRAASRGYQLAPLPAEVLRHGVAARERGLERGAEGARHEAHDDEREPDLAERDRRRERDLREVVDPDAEGMEHQRRAGHEGSDSSPPSGKPRYTLARLSTRSDRVHFSSTAPDEKKNTSYGVIAAPNSAMA